MMAAQLSGEITLYTAFSSINTMFATPKASAPPLPPSPMQTAITGTGSRAKIADQLLLGVAAFLLGHNRHRATREVRQAGHNRGIVAKRPVAMNLLEVRQQTLDIIERVRPLGMTGQQYALPSRV